MSVTALDPFRLAMMRHISELDSFTSSWTSWRPEILGHLGTEVTASSVFDLGDHLSDIFRSRVVTGRDNAALSQSGTAWECLVCWYLNLILWGTNAIAIRPHAGFVPKALRDALTVSIQNFQTNTESDLVVVSVPCPPASKSLTLEDLDQVIRASADKVAVTVVQCKTNWADNSQIPMLWDLIYNSSSFKVPNVSVGRKGISPSSFQKFSYSFVTVPTNPRVNYTDKSLAVLRVRALTGGNYWGRPSKPGVARSLKEFFTTNTSGAFVGTVENHLSKTLLSDPDALNTFLDLTF